MEPLKPGWKTSEFLATLSMLVANLIGVLVVLGYVRAADQAPLTDLVTGLLTGLGAALANAVALWKYISSREMLKMRALDLEHARHALILGQDHATKTPTSTH